MKYLIIINENAQSGKIRKAIPEILKLFKTHLLNFEFHITKSLEEVSQIKYSDPEINTIIAVGGDGTFNGVINNFLEENITFGLIPFGSGNDFPLMLGLKNGLIEALETIKNRNIKNIDLGTIQTERFTKYFINAVGIGFDAKVGYTKNRINFPMSGFSKYLIALFNSLISYKSVEIEIKIDSMNSIHKNIFLTTIGNGKRTGGGFLLTPNAIMDDGKLDICLVNDINKLKVLCNITKVLSGEHLGLKEVEYYRAEKINIYSDEKLFLHYDGETPEKVQKIEINIIPKKVKVISK